VFVEQFGDRYVTVFNPSTKPATARLRLLNAGTADAAEFITGGKWRFDGGVCTVAIPPETVRVLDMK
jgi:hypothetical protein